MPRPFSLSLRKAIVEQYSAGHTFSQIAQGFGLSISGVRRIWKLWCLRAKADLKPDYSFCGHTRHEFDSCVVDKALELKRKHPKWGAGYIRAQLRQKWPNAKLPHVSTLWLWFRKHRLIKPRSSLPAQSSPQWAKHVHQVWQIDAKEAVRLADGSWACWLDVTDEHSGAGLATEVFPPKALEWRGSLRGSAGLAPRVCPMGAS
jgi:transposase